MADKQLKGELDQDLDALEEDMDKALAEVDPAGDESAAADAVEGEADVDAGAEDAEAAAAGADADDESGDAAAGEAAGANADEDDDGEEAEDAGEPVEDEADEAESDLEDTDDSLTYSNGVIEKIVALATREVPHVLGMKGNFMHAIQEQFGGESLTKGVTVEVTDDNRVVVNISVIIEYGAYAPDIFEDIKERVTERLAACTGLEVAGINLRIEDVVTPEELAQAREE